MKTVVNESHDRRMTSYIFLIIKISTSISVQKVYSKTQLSLINITPQSASSA